MHLSLSDNSPWICTNFLCYECALTVIAKYGIRRLQLYLKPE